MHCNQSLSSRICLFELFNYSITQLFVLFHHDATIRSHFKFILQLFTLFIFYYLLLFNIFIFYSLLLFNIFYFIIYYYLIYLYIIIYCYLIYLYFITYC